MDAAEVVGEGVAVVKEVRLEEGLEEDEAGRRC